MGDGPGPPSGTRGEVAGRKVQPGGFRAENIRMTSRTRIQAARTGGRGAAAPFVAAGLVAAFLGGSLGGAAPRPAQAAERRVFSAATQVDTLDHPCSRVHAVAAAELRRDDWEIQRADSSGRRIVTRWKPVEHRLARLALGDVWARCVVDLSPLPGGRTVVHFRGGLASVDDLDSHPAFPAAAITYQKAAERYVGRVRAALERAETASRLTP